MRKHFFNLFFAAFYAIVVASCQATLDEQYIAQEPSESCDVVFVTEPCDGTKTAINVDGSTIKMTWDGTKAEYIHLFENGKEGSNPKISASKDGATATMSASFSGLGLGSLSYHAVVASNYNGGIVTVPSVQSPAATSFDPAADVLLGESRTYLVRQTVTMKFARVVAVSRLSLSGLKPGEKIEMIELVAENNIAGPLKPLDSYKFAGYADDGSKTISLKFDRDNTVSPDGTFMAYFTSWAVEPGNFTLNVLTDKNLYSKSTTKAAGLKFHFDKLRTIKADMAEFAVPSHRYELVTSSPENWEGTYLIVNSDKEGAVKVFNANDKSHGYASDAAVRDVAGKKMIESTDAVDDLSWDFSNSGKKSGDEILWNVMTGTARLVFSDAKYLYDKDGITVASHNYTGLLPRTYYYHKFLYDNGVRMASNNGSKDSYLGYNGSAFAYTSNASSRVYVYKFNDADRKSQVLAYDKEILYWPVTEGKYAIGETYDGQPFSKSSVYQNDLLTYMSSDDAIASVDGQGRITIHKQGTVTITATAAANTQFRGASASYNIVISVPYYQRIYSIDELTGGDKYLIVSRDGLLVSQYHAFDASKSGTYDYDITSLATLLNSPVYDNGDKIKSSAAIDAKQVVIEKGLLSSIASLVGLNGSYTIKPVSVGQYLYCDMSFEEVMDTTIPLTTYKIAFSDANLGSISISGLSSWFNKIATIPHSITFGEGGVASIRSATSSYSAIGADLFYDKLSNRYSYVNMMIFDNFDNVAELMAYFGQNTEYAWLLNLIKNLGNNITIRDIIDYFAGDLYIYKYVG